MATSVATQYLPFLKGQTNRFSLSDMYTYMMQHQIDNRKIYKILCFQIYADELQTYVLDRLQISYEDRTVLDLYTPYYKKYQGGIELSTVLRFEELLMYCNVYFTSFAIYHDRKMIQFWYEVRRDETK